MDHQYRQLDERIFSMHSSKEKNNFNMFEEKERKKYTKHHILSLISQKKYWFWYQFGILKFMAFI